MSAQGSAAREPLRGFALAVTAGALALGTFMVVLDTTIANVSLPTISGNLGVSPSQGTWVITSFAAANGVFVPLTGWLMGRFGVVRVFVVSVLAFTFASFLCGTAWSLGTLVAFRVLQGAASGPMVPGSQALLISIFPENRRGSALGIWSMTTLVAPICGPLLGGYISDNLHWSWIFLINVPVGFVCAYLCWRNLARRETPTRNVPIDRVGLVLLIVWVGALQIMLDTGKDADWFSSTEVTVLAITALVGAVLFVIWELTEAFPIVDLSLFTNRNFALGSLALCIGYALFFANIVLLPLWLQTQLGYTATWAGIVSAPAGVVAVVLTPFVARSMSAIDARWVATIAFIAFAVSYFMRAALTADASLAAFVTPLLVQGVGMSTFFVAMIAISLYTIPPHRIPSATGISNFVRIIAGSFAASITTTLWDRREALHQSRLVETSTAFNPAFRQAVDLAGHLGLGGARAYSLIIRGVIGQAYLLSSLDLFWISAWLCLIAIVFVWLARRSVGSAGAVGGE